MENKGILNGNHLKLIAAFSMLLDHAGILLFPQIRMLRIIGRLAYPIFAFMIAEGCRYTKNWLRHFLLVFGLGVGCQLVYLLVGGAAYLNILLTFSCSVLLIYALQEMYRAENWKKEFLWSVMFALGVFAALLIDRFLTIDYGFWGIMVPVFVSFTYARRFPRWASVFILGIGLVLLGADIGGIQYYGLLAVPLLLLYNGQRGKCNLKYFFYIFYPAHLAMLQGIAWLER